MTESHSPIRPKERAAIIQSLRAGVVPRVGLQHIAVGRAAEVAAILQDLQSASDGGAAIRFIVGRFGSGKSFFLNLASVVALEKRFLTTRVDITPDCRLHGNGGQARALFTELMRNLSSKARPDGGALAGVVERWISDVYQQHVAAGRSEDAIGTTIRERLQPLQELTGGFDLCAILTKYFQGFRAGDTALQQNALRWLRGEYGTKTEARQDLGVRAIVDDADVYDYLKLFAAFARMAGFAGLVVNIDELVVLSHRLASSKARAANYETILRILNDCLQSKVEGLIFLFGATDEALEDPRRGLFSYEALATRLAGNEFAREGVVDLAGPVIRLKSLTKEDLFVLLMNIRQVFAGGDPAKYLLPDDGLQAYLDYCARTLGDAYFRTPRDSITRFVGFLSLLEQNPGLSWQSMLGKMEDIQGAPSQSAEVAPAVPDDGDDLAHFKL